MNSGKIALIFYVFFLLLTIALMLISFPVGLYTVFFTHLSNTSLAYTSPVSNIVFFLGLTEFSIPVATSLGSVFAISTVIYAGLFGLAAFQRRNIFSAIRSALANGSSDLFSNPLLAMLIALGSTTIAIGILDRIQTGSGIPTGSLKGDPLILFVSVTFAPLREEIGFRVALIGAVALILGLRSSMKTALRALWRPSAILAGRPGDLTNRVGLTLILVVSSAFFGLAHYISGGGWEIGKVSEAAFAGIVLGYLYIRYGIQAAILLHWGVNYFGTAYAFFGQGVWGIPWTSDIGNPLDVLVVLDLFFFIGATSLFLVGYKILKRLIQSRSATESAGSRGVNPEGVGQEVQGDRPILGRELRRGRLRAHG